ncbi:MAG: hypothetical protein K5906_04450 [Bacilli bacterium]|nr:hypothetical protein [Bacilli bacterium]
MNKEDNKEIKEKEESEWDKMMYFIFSHKRYILTLFPIILVAIFLGAICSSLQKNGHTLYLFFAIVGIVILLGLTIFMVIITKKKFRENNISSNIYISIIFAYMFLSGLILMIFFKVLSMINQDSIFNMTGLLSVIVVLAYILLTVATFYIDFDVSNKHKEDKKREQHKK